MMVENPTQIETEKVVLVGLITQSQNEKKAKEYLDELAFLADTAGAVVVKKFLQLLRPPSHVSCIGWFRPYTCLLIIYPYCAKL